MKRRFLLVISIIFSALLIIGGWAYLEFDPLQHFESTKIPVVALPHVHKESLIAPTKKPNTGNVTSPVFIASFHPVGDATKQTIPNKTPAQTLKQVSKQSSSAKKIIKKQKNHDTSFNVLVLGVDARKNENSRTDVIMVAHVIPALKKVNFISIPRDTRVYISGVGYTKINHAHILGELRGGNHAGTIAAIQAVCDFLNIPINYYMKTNFIGFQHFVDSIGGVEMQLPHPVKISTIRTISTKKQLFDGKLALQIAKDRYFLANGDFGRQMNQFAILKAIATKLLRPSYIPKIPQLYKEASKDVLDTNLTKGDLISLAWMFKGMTGKNLSYRQIPGHSDYVMDPLVKKKLYYWIPDLEKVRAISVNYLQS